MNYKYKKNKMETNNLNNNNKNNLEENDIVCNAIKKLIKDGRIVISLYTYPGRGWIDVRVSVDGECLTDIGCAI